MRLEHRQRVRTQVDSVDKNMPPLAGVEPGSSCGQLDRQHLGSSISYHTMEYITSVRGLPKLAIVHQTKKLGFFFWSLMSANKEGVGDARQESRFIFTLYLMYVFLRLSLKLC